MKLLFTGFSLAAALVSTGVAHSHCQLPCGIYDDHARVHSMLEDADTIQKTVILIKENSGKNDAQSNNQLVRSIANKESHAQSIIETISDYFLTQRVKPSQSDYTERLKKHHAVIVASMKAKQNSDLQHVDDLKLAIVELEQYYPRQSD
ncbi:MAG: superoxide dismutase [Cyanobium sp. ARS6]|uniref:superoxide dismutase [Ni] n=1 Tax=Synechococcus sp. MIT S9507 TaxID=3082544 RepID=UPI000C66E1BB|nr:superoxide dismutase [Cyanobium sp. ARS6]